MKTLLVTGYEPFAGYELNCSWECAAALPDEVAGVRIVKRLLPVEYARGTDMLNAAIDEVKPDAVLSLGMAPGWKALSIERMAFNMRETERPDNAGVVKLGEPVAADGDDGYFTNLPHRAMKARLEAEDIPVAYSTAPGFYLCNNAMYVAQYRRHTDMPGLVAGFIHVPLMEGQSDTLISYPKATLVRGLELCCEEIAKCIQE